MFLSRFVCLFIIYSLVGWIYESLFCTVSSGKWENRGFLYGPCCPIYGTGAVAISIVMSMITASGSEVEPWKIFVISVIGSVILEFTTSLVLEKLFHAVWWDYSNLPFNIQGRISLFTSLGFGVAGLLVVYKIAPFTESVMDDISATATEILAFLFVILFTMDLTLTVSALLDFDQAVMHAEQAFNQNMDTIVGGAVVRTSRIKRGIVKRKNLADMQLHALSEAARMTIRRAKSLRYDDKNEESLRNQLLKAIKQRAIGSRSGEHETSGKRDGEHDKISKQNSEHVASREA